MMTFRRMAGESFSPVVREDEAELLRLTLHAEMALRSGLPLPPYLEVDWLTRRAFIAASDSLRVLAAQRVGLATLSPMGAAMAGAELDGGEAAESTFLAQQTAVAVANVEREMEAAHGP